MIETWQRYVCAMLAMVVLLLATAACTSQPADVASENLSTAADNFEINRRIVFYNGITDAYILIVEGQCSVAVDVQDEQLEVTCKTGKGTYKKHYLGLADNVSYFVEQLDDAGVSAHRYRVVFRPSTVLPDPELDTGG